MKKVIMPALAFVLFATAANAQDVKKTNTTPKPQTTQAAQAQKAQPAAQPAAKNNPATAKQMPAVEKKNTPAQSATPTPSK